MSGIGNMELDMIDERKLQTFGRVKSKKLSANQQRLFDEFLPMVSISHYNDLNPSLTSPSVGKIATKAPLPEGGVGGGLYKELILEIGFGGGEHLVHQALSNPDNLYMSCIFKNIGIETGNSLVFL